MAALEADVKLAAEEERRIEAEKQQQRNAEGRKKPGKPAAPLPDEPDPQAQRNFSAAAAGRGVFGAAFRLWLFGVARPSPLRRTVRVDFARRDLSGKIPHPAGPQPECSRAWAAMQEIADWLTRLGLPEYAGAFAENAFPRRSPASSGRGARQP
jgi:hypothetical protein